MDLTDGLARVDRGCPGSVPLGGFIREMRTFAFCRRPARRVPFPRRRGSLFSGGRESTASVYPGRSWTRLPFSRGKEPRKEYYSIQNAGDTTYTYTPHEIPTTSRKPDLPNQPRSTKTWVHEMNGSEESQGLWDEPVEGESVEIDE